MAENTIPGNSLPNSSPVEPNHPAAHSSEELDKQTSTFNVSSDERPHSAFEHEGMVDFQSNKLCLQPEMQTAHIQTSMEENTEACPCKRKRISSTSSENSDPESSGPHLSASDKIGQLQAKSAVVYCTEGISTESTIESAKNKNISTSLDVHTVIDMTLNQVRPDHTAKIVNRDCESVESNPIENTKAELLRFNDTEKGSTKFVLLDDTSKVPETVGLVADSVSIRNAELCDSVGKEKMTTDSLILTEAMEAEHCTKPFVKKFGENNFRMVPRKEIREENTERIETGNLSSDRCIKCGYIVHHGKRMLDRFQQLWDYPAKDNHGEDESGIGNNGSGGYVFPSRHNTLTPSSHMQNTNSVTEHQSADNLNCLRSFEDSSHHNSECLLSDVACSKDTRIGCGNNSRCSVEMSSVTSNTDLNDISRGEPNHSCQNEAEINSIYNKDLNDISQGEPNHSCQNEEESNSIYNKDLNDISRGEPNHSYQNEAKSKVCICTQGDQLHINSLPSSILVHVFEYLSVYVLLMRAGLVCQLWRQLCCDADIWRRVNLRFQLKVSDKELLSLLSYSDRVVHLDISDNRLVTDVGLTFAMKKCSHLSSLRLTRCFKLKDDGFKAIGMYCHHIGEIYLDGCYSITDCAVTVIAEGCPRLKCLHLNQCGKISNTGVVALAQHCHSLQHLLLDHCHKVTDTGAAELSQGCPEIKILSVMACGLTDAGVKHFTLLKKLELLDISNISKLTPDGVVAVARGCTDLECLNISLNSVMDDNCVEVIAKHSHKLRRLYCVSCSLTDRALESLGTYSKTIENLDIGWCKDITDEGVKTISMSCPSLRFLGLIRCDQVTVDTMEELIVTYPHIKYSTFVLESRKLLERARQEGFQFSDDASKDS